MVAQQLSCRRYCATQLRSWPHCWSMQQLLIFPCRLRRSGWQGVGGPEPLRWDEYAATNAVAWDFRDEGEQRAQKMIRLLGCLEMGGGGKPMWQKDRSLVICIALSLASTKLLSFAQVLSKDMITCCAMELDPSCAMGTNLLLAVVRFTFRSHLSINVT